MKAKDITQQSPFREHKSYSPEEALAAGGTTAFGIKVGKSTEKLIATLEKLPPIEPFTDEEWADLLVQMANDK
jgi:hypothetical protein